MAKQRFRDIKQGRQKKQAPNTPAADNPAYTSAGLKIKAFLTDAFMLLMPIMYIVFYLVMDGREDFAEHKLAGWIYILVPLIIVQTLFMYRTGQTPGYRAYNITLIDAHTRTRPSLGVIVFRNSAAILSFFTIFGWLLMFFRKDHKTLHDLLSATAVVDKK
ncbi:MAG TPA: RDD family protein [Sulfurovum sp.]|uniref:RDD family protein n=1 Tax=Sulfurovum sp. TaxID=1969726 RepID=UPI002F946DF4